MHLIGESMWMPGASLVEDVDDVALELVEVTPREMPGGKEVHHGATHLVEALCVDLLLRELVVHLVVGDEATRLDGPLPGKVLEKHRRRLADVVASCARARTAVASSCPPPARVCVYVCEEAMNGWIIITIIVYGST